MINDDFKTEPEKILRIDALVAAFNQEKYQKDRKLVVDLACGHKAYTGSRNRMICPRCTEMLKRSIADGSEDYETFRKGDRQDQMIWREDPCRLFNEPTDLEGRFVND